MRRSVEIDVSGEPFHLELSFSALMGLERAKVEPLAAMARVSTFEKLGASAMSGDSVAGTVLSPVFCIKVLHVGYKSGGGELSLADFGDVVLAEWEAGVASEKAGEFLALFLESGPKEVRPPAGKPKARRPRKRSL